MQHETSEGDPQRARSEAALTPRPVRLLLVGRVRPGREREVREAQARFPIDAAAAAGIAAVEAFIGSRHYALTFEVDTDNIQQALATCLNDSRIRAFLASLQPAVEDLPGPDWRFSLSDGFHDAAAGNQSAAEDTGHVYSTANLPLAANMYRWRVGEAPQIGEAPLGGGGLSL